MCKKHAHLDYKTADAGYSLRLTQCFDLKYKLSGVTDPWRHKKYIDLQKRSSDVVYPLRHKKYIEDRASDARNQTHYHCKSLIQTYNSSKHILVQNPEKTRKSLT